MESASESVIPVSGDSVFLHENSVKMRIKSRSVIDLNLLMNKLILPCKFSYDK